MTKFLPKILIALLLLISIPGFSQVFPVEPIHYSGSPNEFLNIVIMGDGYTASQQDKFITDATSAVNGFLNQEPFNTYRDSINVFAVKVVSNVEGAAMNQNSLIDNYFGSSYGSYNIDRLLVAWHTSKIHNVLNANTPFYDEAVIIVNHTKYGGSGGEFAVFSTDDDAVDLMIHEFGHSFAGLADEYWAGDNYASENTNMTKNNDPNTVKWKDFLQVNGVGIYPHEESPTWFRPHQNCEMRYLGREFCAVCNNKISNDIEGIANTNSNGAPISYFAADEVEILKGTTVSFHDYSTNRPTSWEWTFDGGTPASSNEQNPTVTYAGEGKFTVSLRAGNADGSNTMTKTDYITVAAPLSTSNLDFSKYVSIFPNPVQNELNVSISSQINISNYRILNATGVIVKEGIVNNQISVSELATGMYIIQMYFDGGTVTKRFIKD